nr:hypothetical protein [Nitrospinaceae bacterium]NIR53919.1 hypothetical protein [Nitrospinaceae bacterium]NIS84336.1 hypothetical protein [Nitrospinaceae bacterium]NIT81140.1 hypothetical protein [Nitrospinaceae bacterium]NIU43422.1 hypothetical protein [Nitrospinaceae bacterium]
MNENLRFQDVEALFEGRKRGNQLMASGIHLTPEEARLLWTSPRTRE